MSRPITSEPSLESLQMLLRSLSLPCFVQHAHSVARQAETQGWTFTQYLHHLAEIEADQRRQRRIERNLKQSKLLSDKTLASLRTQQLPAKVSRLLPTLCEGGFVDRADNLVVFGLPGHGKTHLVCAIAHELILKGYRVLFTPTFALVQRLLAAKRDLELEKLVVSLDAFDAIILDDLGYVQQDRQEMEVLFTFLAQRYERKSVIITTNLVFSQWDQIFKDPLTTAAAVDRIVHHSVIIEMEGPSVRAEEARNRMAHQQESQATSACPTPVKETVSRKKNPNAPIVSTAS